MRIQGNYRRTGSVVTRARRPVRAAKKPFFLFKLFFILLLLGVFVGGGWLAVSKGYACLKQSDVAHWHVKSVQVEGLSGLLHKELLAKGQIYEGKEFSISDAGALRSELVKKYPMLKDVSVSRGLLSGKLTIEASLREPVAQFQLPDHSIKYVDKDSVIYSDPNPTLRSVVPTVQLTGPVPERLQPDFVDLVNNALKLDRKLKFESLSFDLQHNTITMKLPDNSIVHFGKAEFLKQKAQRAAQIMAYAREHQLGKVSLDFNFFEDGKVFLTQGSH